MCLCTVQVKAWISWWFEKVELKNAKWTMYRIHHGSWDTPYLVVDYFETDKLESRKAKFKWDSTDPSTGHGTHHTSWMVVWRRYVRTKKRSGQVQMKLHGALYRLWTTPWAVKGTMKCWTMIWKKGPTIFLLDPTTGRGTHHLLWWVPVVGMIRSWRFPSDTLWNPSRVVVWTTTRVGHLWTTPNQFSFFF